MHVATNGGQIQTTCTPSNANQRRLLDRISGEFKGREAEKEAGRSSMLRGAYPRSAARRRRAASGATQRTPRVEEAFLSAGAKAGKIGRVRRFKKATGLLPEEPRELCPPNSRERCRISQKEDHHRDQHIE